MIDHCSDNEFVDDVVDASRVGTREKGFINSSPPRTNLIGSYEWFLSWNLSHNQRDERSNITA
jgi:hypothetical protein